MVYACVLGLMLLWPVIRLSQEQTDPHGARPRGGLTPGYIWLDWFCLALVLQSVIWPLHLTAGWSFPRTWWLNGTLCAWSLLAGFITALGCRSRQVVGRSLAMAGCVLLLVGEPLLLALAGDWLTQLAGGPWVYRLTPLRLINLLLNEPHAFVATRDGVQVALVAGAAAVGWIGLALLRKPAAPADSPAMSPGVG